MFNLNLNYSLKKYFFCLKFCLYTKTRSSVCSSQTKNKSIHPLFITLVYFFKVVCVKAVLLSVKFSTFENCFHICINFNCL